MNNYKILIFFIGLFFTPHYAVSNELLGLDGDAGLLGLNGDNELLGLDENEALLGLDEKFPKGKYIQAPQNAFKFERVHGIPNFEKLNNFPKGSLEYKLAQRVAHLTISGSMCTGFLVGANLLLTNHHCIDDGYGGMSSPSAFSIYMDYWHDGNKGKISSKVNKILYYNKKLDYALLQLSHSIGNQYGWLELDGNGTEYVTDRVKIIQHPQGRSKEITRKHTQIQAIFSKKSVLHYLADTQGGSSGSPVFPLNGSKVIALHHAGKKDNNEGILMSAIIPDIMKWVNTTVTSQPSRRKQGDIAWRVKNLYPYKVYLAFYSQQRNNYAWPGSNRVYVLNDNREYVIKTLGLKGEKICYGAWVIGHPSTYWGVGRNNRQGCQDCCKYATGVQSDLISLMP